MKIGISSWAYAWNIKKTEESDFSMDAFALLEKAHEFQVDVLQIADNLPLDTLSLEEQHRLKDLAFRYGIQLECGTQGIRSEKLIPFIEMASFFGSPLLRTLIHDAQGCPTPEEAEQEIRNVLPYLHKTGITLAIENHDFFPVRVLKELIDRVHDPYVKICLDPVNNFAQGEGTGEVLQVLQNDTVNFHCKDYIVKRKSGGLGFDVEGCIAGEGLLNIPEIFHGFPTSVSCILELWTPWQGNLSQTRVLESEWVKKSVDYLKTI